MKATLWITSFASMVLFGCVGEKTPTYDNPIDPGAKNYRNYPSLTLEETGGMIDDFEDKNDISLLGALTSNWGPSPEDAAGTVRMVEYSNVGGSASTSPLGHLRMTTHFGTGAGNFSGVSLILVDGQGKPLDIRGYQGLVFQLRGDPGLLKVTMGSPILLDANDAATVVEVVPRDWQQVYIPFEDSLFGCNYKPGCPLLSTYLHQVSAVSFNLSGWSRSTRKLDIDLVQLIAKGGPIPSAAKPLQQFRLVNVVEERKDHLFFDFNESPDDTVIIAASSGAQVSTWSVIKSDPVTMAIMEEGAAPGSYKSLKLDFSFSTGNTTDQSSMVGMNLDLESSYSGRDLSKVKGLRFYAKITATGKLRSTLRLWSDIVQNDQDKDYNAPEYVFTATKDWAKKEILFATGQVCAYRGTTTCPSYTDVLKKIQSLQFVMGIDQATALTGTLMIDDVEFIY